MNDKQRLVLLRKAQAELRQTKTGYSPHGQHWKPAIVALDKLADDLGAVLPALGPVWSGGKAVTAQDLTHATGGLPLYPAFDDAFSQNGGIIVIAPERLIVRKGSSSHPGDAFYGEGDSGLRYWFGHLVTAPSVGRVIKKGARIGVTLKHNIGGGPHVHVGINVEKLFGPGKQLLYGKTGHGPDYTHGSPTIGVQLAEGLT